MHSASYGIALKIISTLFFTLMSALVQKISSKIPVGEMVFFRCYLALIPLFIWELYYGRLREVYKTQHPIKHLTRASNSFIGMTLGFLALYFIPLTDQVAVIFIWPLITIPLAVIFLKEQVGIYRWSAVIIGLIGVGVILYPHITLAERGSAATIGALLAFFAAFSYAGGSIIVRSMSSTETSAATVFYFCVIAGAISLFTIPLGFIYPEQAWQIPSLEVWGYLFAIGILGGLGQMYMTESFRHADATLLAPLEYIAMIWASLFGYLFAGQIPTQYTIYGSVIVMCAGLILIIRERQLGLKRKAEEKQRL